MLKLPRAVTRRAEDERAKFIEAAETELLGLHAGNFARYQIRSSEFAAWRKVWARRPPRKKVRR